MFEDKGNALQNDMFNKELEFNKEQAYMGYAQGDQFQEQVIEQKKTELTRWQQDLGPEIEMQIHIIKNEYMDENGDWVRMTYFTGRYADKEGKRVPVYKKMKPKMNDIGINWLRSQIVPLISRNLMMSNYDEDRILLLLRSTMLDFITHLTYNKDLYAVDKGDLTHIVRMFKSTVTPSFFRCLKAGERVAGTTIRKEFGATTYNEAPKQKAAPFWGIGGR